MYVRAKAVGGNTPPRVPKKPAHAKQFSHLVNSDYSFKCLLANQYLREVLLLLLFSSNCTAKVFRQNLSLASCGEFAGSGVCRLFLEPACTRRIGAESKLTLTYPRKLLSLYVKYWPAPQESKAHPAAVASTEAASEMPRSLVSSLVFAGTPERSNVQHPPASHRTGCFSSM